MKKTKIKKISIFLTSILLFGFLVSCDPNPSESSEGENEATDCEVWGCSPLVKVMRDKDDEKYYAADKDMLV